MKNWLEIPIQEPVVAAIKYAIDNGYRVRISYRTEQFISDSVRIAQKDIPTIELIPLDQSV